jgi:hypothetical protein
VAVMEQAIEIFCSTGSIRMVFNDWIKVINRVQNIKDR